MDILIYVCVAIAIISALTVSFICARKATKGPIVAQERKIEESDISIDDAVHFLKLTNLEDVVPFDDSADL